MRVLLLAVAALVLGAVPAAATDLAKIDRTIEKSPSTRTSPL